MDKRIDRSISKTIFWYVVSETFFSFFVSFMFFIFIFFVNQLLLMAQNILTKHVPLFQVALLVLFAFPSIIAISAPFACLTGTLMTIGRLTSDNEILVMLSSGLSYRNIFLPAVMAGVIISLGSFFANDVLLPAGRLEFNKLSRRIAMSTPALELEANSVKRFKDTLIVTGNVAGTTINDVLILDKTADGERRVIMARQAELKDAGQEGLSLDLNDAFIQSTKEIARTDYDYASARDIRYWVPQEDFFETVTAIGPGEKSSVDVWKEIITLTAALEARLDEQRGRLLTQALDLEESLRRGPGDESWNRRSSLDASVQREILALENSRQDRNLSLHRLEFFKKFSVPFGAFSFIFLALPLGFLAKKSGQTVGFILGVFISVIYWALLFGGQTMGLRLGYSPFWSMWLPNILALGIGITLCIHRIRR